VLSVSSQILFVDSELECMCVYMHTHTHTAREVIGFEPRVIMRHLESPKNPVGLILKIHMTAYVYEVHMYIYMLGGGMRFWTNCSFLLKYFSFRRKKKSKRCERTGI